MEVVDPPRRGRLPSLLSAPAPRGRKVATIYLASPSDGIPFALADCHVQVEVRAVTTLSNQ